MLHALMADAAGQLLERQTHSQGNFVPLELQHVLLVLREKHKERRASY